MYMERKRKHSNKSFILYSSNTKKLDGTPIKWKSGLLHTPAGILRLARLINKPAFHLIGVPSNFLVFDVDSSSGDAADRAPDREHVTIGKEIARHLRPRTLRAHFGKNKIKNAVHCTDLPEDALLEVQYFFKILDS